MTSSPDRSSIDSDFVGSPRPGMPATDALRIPSAPHSNRAGAEGSDEVIGRQMNRGFRGSIDSG